MSERQSEGKAKLCNSVDESKDLKERHASALSELSSLGRVSHRLAMTDDGPPLQKVLSLLLPRLLVRVGSNQARTMELDNIRWTVGDDCQPQQQQQEETIEMLLRRVYEKIHGKLVEMLGHIMKRVRADEKCSLPCLAILHLLYDSSTRTAKGSNEVDAFTLNLSLAFLTLGLPRCSGFDAEGLLPGLIALLGKFSGVRTAKSTTASNAQCNQVGHLVLRAIEMLVTADRTPSKSERTDDNSSDVDDNVLESRTICRDDSLSGAALYDLLLDVLLYHPTMSSLLSSSRPALVSSSSPPSLPGATATASPPSPPPGLSSAGHARLMAGTSIRAKNWTAEFSPPVRLRDLKLAVLKFISPSFRFAIFEHRGGRNPADLAVSQTAAEMLGTARTVSLLVVSTGDQRQEVAENASSQLKMFIDRRRHFFRNKSDTSNGSSGGSDNDFQPASLFGDSVALSCQLLSLVLGGIPSSTLLCRCEDIAPLGAKFLVNSVVPASSSLSYYRSLVSEKVASALLEFASTRVFDEEPRIFSSFATAPISFDSTVQKKASVPCTVGLLAVAASHHYLSGSLTVGSGVVGSSKGNPNVAAASVLNSLCVRLTAYYDSLTNLEIPVSSGSATSGVISGEKVVIENLLSRILAISCSVLASASSPLSGISPFHHDARNSCYGILCTLARSRCAMAPTGFLFDCGSARQSSLQDQKVSLSTAPPTCVSTATAAMAFGCVANEEEVLQTRATAALDALLGAYCRLFKSQKQINVSNLKQEANDVDMSEATERVIAPLSSEGSGEKESPANPWQHGCDSAIGTNGNGTPALTSKSMPGMMQSLLPLLWSSAQSSQPKASRLAAATWAKDLVRFTDFSNACHMLCFLAGDEDSTTASVAMEGLGLSEASDREVAESHESNLNFTLDENAERHLPDFNDVVILIFASRTARASSWRPIFYDFSSRGKASTLRFALSCLLSDLYGGDDASVKIYMEAISDTLHSLSRLFGLHVKPLLPGGDVVHSSSTLESHGREATDLLDACSVCLSGCIAASSFSRALMVEHSTLNMNHNFIASLAISAPSSKARRFFARCSGMLYEDVNIWGAKASTQRDICSWADSSGIAHVMEICSGKLSAMKKESFRVSDVHGAAYLGAQCLRALRLISTTPSIVDTEENPIENEVEGRQINTPSAGLVIFCWERASSILAELGSGCLHRDEVVGKACSESICIALSYDGFDAPLMKKCLHDAATQAISNVALALRRFGNGDATDAVRTLSLVRAAGLSLAASTSGSGSVVMSRNCTSSLGLSGLGPARLNCVDAVFKLLGSSSYRKDPEIALAAGEALAHYADGYSPPGSSWTIPETSEPKDYDEAYASALPPHEHVVYRILNCELRSNSPQRRTSCAPAMLALVGRAVYMASKGCEMLNREHFQTVSKKLIEYQSAFLTLLADPKCNHLCRESCCLGLAACQGVASYSRNSAATPASNNDLLNVRLLKAFGQTTNFGGSALMESRSQEAARRRENEGDRGGTAASMLEDLGIDEASSVQEGGTAGLAEAALGAYREMAAAALSLDRPDILYALMILSITHPVWSTPGYKSRYSSSSLLGKAGFGANNIDELRLALRPRLSKLVPRLLRACNDPNKQTREQIGTLWASLTGGGSEARKVIAEHLLSTIDTLIQDASCKLWRARVGACGALSDVIVGRTWEELGGGGVATSDDIHGSDSGSREAAGVRLLRLWRVTVRAMDDVRLAVRESGESLARSMRALTVRLCDPTTDFPACTPVQSAMANNVAEETAAAAASTALGWLVQHGLNQPCAEATGACVSCLLGIVEVARPSALHLVLPELIGSLAMAISGLEPAALNYLQVRASGVSGPGGSELVGGGYERLERLRLQLAQSGPINGALTKCLEMVRHVPLKYQRAVIPYLDTALRSGSGFATRSAAADAVTALCGTCPESFQFPGHSMNNPTVRLLRALYFASERERGTMARDKMAHALGSVASLAPGPSVRILAVRACEKYSRSVGSNDDPAARRAAASGLRAIAVRASAQFSDGGPNDIWCRCVLPAAYLGIHDEDAKIATLWKDVWDEGGAAASKNESQSSTDFGYLLQEQLLTYLVRACVEALGDVSWSRRRSACVCLISLADQNVLAPLPRSVERQNNNAESSQLLRARVRAQSSCIVLTAGIKMLQKKRIWTGKVELVKAIVKVTGKWYLEDERNRSFYGCEVDGRGEICKCVPLTSEFLEDDLFVQDSWFINAGTDDVEDVDEVQVGAHRSNVDEPHLDGNLAEEGKPLNFQEMENQLIEESVACVEKKAETQDCEGMRTATFSGICRLLVEQAGLHDPGSSSFLSGTEVLPYRAAALEGLSTLLQNTRSNGKIQIATSVAENKESFAVDRNLYRLLSTYFLAVLDDQSSSKDKSLTPSDNSQKGVSKPPLIVARSLSCLSAALYYGIGEDNAAKEMPLCENVLNLSKLFQEACGPLQPAWTVREAAALAGANLASKAAFVSLRKLETIKTLIDCTSQTAKDRKFWRVRLAGLKLLLALVQRAGESGQSITMGVPSCGTNNLKAEHQLLLESLLPYKERISKLAKSSLTDNEAKVTAVASNIFSAISWWP